MTGHGKGCVCMACEVEVEAHASRATEATREAYARAEGYDRVRALLLEVSLTVQFSGAGHHQALLADIRKELAT